MIKPEFLRHQISSLVNVEVCLFLFVCVRMCGWWPRSKSSFSLLNILFLFFFSLSKLLNKCLIFSLTDEKIPHHTWFTIIIFFWWFDMAWEILVIGLCAQFNIWFWIIYFFSHFQLIIRHILHNVMGWKML